jgi:predicted DNA-binding transcriptional regulator AlpA
MSNTTWLTIRDLQSRFQLSRAGIYALIARGVLPRPIHLGRAARWEERLIVAAEQRLISAERGGEAP